MSLSLVTRCSISVVIAFALKRVSSASKACSSAPHEGRPPTDIGCSAEALAGLA
jgi:hypothetical protein